MAITFGKSSPNSADEAEFRDEEDVTIEADEPAKTVFGSSPDDSSDESFSEAESKVAKLRAELKECQKEKQEYMDGWQRAKADYVNAIKRFESELARAHERGLLKAVEELLPALDALERAKEHGELPEGFNGIVKQLEGAFSTLGLTEVGRIGEAFDPALHDALGQDSVDTNEGDGTVTAVLEKGWKINESIVRPAKVRVGQFSA